MVYLRRCLVNRTPVTGPLLQGAMSRKGWLARLVEGSGGFDGFCPLSRKRKISRGIYQNGLQLSTALHRLGAAQRPPTLVLDAAVTGLLLNNVRHERRPKGRESAFGPSAR